MAKHEGGSPSGHLQNKAQNGLALLHAYCPPISLDKFKKYKAKINNPQDFAQYNKVSAARYAYRSAQTHTDITCALVYNCMFTQPCCLNREIPCILVVVYFSNYYKIISWLYGCCSFVLYYARVCIGLIVHVRGCVQHYIPSPVSFEVASLWHHYIGGRGLKSLGTPVLDHSEPIQHLSLVVYNAV